jgi:CRP-like cAMP-binding protein
MEHTPLYEDALAQVPLFQGLSRRELQVLSANSRELDYAVGATLLRQGDTGVGLFIITSGSVHVSQVAPDGVTRELGDFGRGATLGEMSLLDDMPRTATVTATEPTKAIVIPVWDFRAALREAPEISIKLLTVLSHRLRASEAQSASQG